MLKKSQVILLATAIGGFLVSSAQDSSKNTIVVSSSFKPVLRNFTKLGFSSTPPIADADKPKFVYKIPSQNVTPRFQPLSIKPLSLDRDTSKAWANSNFLKLGYGNLKSPFLSAGFSFASEKSNMNLYFDQLSAKGSLPFQEYSNTAATAVYSTRVGDITYLDAKFGFKREKFFQYGFDTSLYEFERNDLLHRFNTISGQVAVRNIELSDYGLKYHPLLKFDLFKDAFQNNETNIFFEAPFEKNVGNNFGVNLGFTADFNQYVKHLGNPINNYIINIPVSLRFKTNKLNLHAGMSPSWDVKKINLLPDVSLEYQIVNDKWIFQGGYTGYYHKGSYMSLIANNPFMEAPDKLLNNKIIEIFAGFKGTVLNHFNYNAKVGYVEFHQLPLFINDSISGKGFLVSFEERAKALQIHGEVGVVEAERFSMISKFNWYTFTSLKTESKPWGIIPLEFSTVFRWNMFKNVWLTSDFFLWEGSLYTNKFGIKGRNKAAIDLNAGLEIGITKNFLFWSSFNNLFNSKYERWHQYPNFGFNMLGGLLIRFNQ